LNSNITWTRHARCHDCVVARTTQIKSTSIYRVWRVKWNWVLRNGNTHFSWSRTK